MSVEQLPVCDDEIAERAAAPCAPRRLRTASGQSYHCSVLWTSLAQPSTRLAVACTASGTLKCCVALRESSSKCRHIGRLPGSASVHASHHYVIRRARANGAVCNRIQELGMHPPSQSTRPIAAESAARRASAPRRPHAAVAMERGRCRGRWFSGSSQAGLLPPMPRCPTEHPPSRQRSRSSSCCVPNP